jgi:hypothetical protein
LIVLIENVIVPACPYPRPDNSERSIPSITARKFPDHRTEAEWVIGMGQFSRIKLVNPC